MIKGGLNAFFLQLLTHLFTGFARETVNNSGFVAIFVYYLHYLRRYVLVFVFYLVIQVGPVEGTLEEVTVLNSQSSDDVLLDEFRHCCSQRQNGSLRVLFLYSR